MGRLSRVIRSRSIASTARSWPRRQRGFTLAECLIASVVLAITVLGVASAMTVGSASTDKFDADAPAMSIARQLMEETVARPFDPPATGNHAGWGGRNGNHDSSTYDDIGDFKGYGALVYSLITPAGGSVVEYQSSFIKSVSVDFRATPDGVSTPGGDFALITVTVTPSDEGNPVTLYRMVSRYTKG